MRSNGFGLIAARDERIKASRRDPATCYFTSEGIEMRRTSGNVIRGVVLEEFQGCVVQACIKICSSVTKVLV